jgi:16S rRNA (uracil1498-N3)-methyltransferase
LITLLVEPSHFDAGGPGRQELVVEAEAYRHLFRARRLAVGDRLRVVDGTGRARWGQVVRVGRTAAIVALGEPAAPNEPRLRLELLVPTLRPERAAWLVEKATELGAAAVRFLNTERAPRSFGGGTAGRLQRVAAAAVEQCHRALCPEITGPHPFTDLLGPGPWLDPTAQRWVLDPAAAPTASLPKPAAEGREYLLTGPEGGWTAAETAALASCGWKGLGLGARILRVETAAIAAAVLRLLPETTWLHPAPSPPC